MPLKRIPEDDIKSLNGIDYSKYFDLDIDFSKLTPEQLRIMTNQLDVSKKYFKRYLEKEHSIADETEEAVRLRSESMQVFRIITTATGGKRTSQKRNGNRTRRK